MGHGIEFPVKNDDVVRCAVCVGNNRNEQTTTTRENCNEMRGVNYRQMVSKAAHKDLVHVRWNDVR